MRCDAMRRRRCVLYIFNGSHTCERRSRMYSVMCMGYIAHRVVSLSLSPTSQRRQRHHHQQRGRRGLRARKRRTLGQHIRTAANTPITVTGTAKGWFSNRKTDHKTRATRTKKTRTNRAKKRRTKLRVTTIQPPNATTRPLCTHFTHTLQCDV